MNLMKWAVAFAVLSLAGSGASQAAMLENGAIRLSVDDAGKVEILDKQSNVAWKQADVPTARAGAPGVTDLNRQTVLKIESVKQDGDSIVLAAQWQIPLTIRWSLKAEREIQVSLESPEADKSLVGGEEGPEARLLYPAPFYCRAASLVVFPEDEGVLYETAEIDPRSDDVRWAWKPVRNLSMPWWGVTDGERGLMTLLDTPFHAQSKLLVCETADGKRALPALHWVPSRTSWDYPRRVTFRVVPSGGYVDMAKRFRRWMQDQGLFRTWEEKARDLPQIRQLKGAMDLWVFAFERPMTAEDVRRIKDFGFSKLLLQTIAGNQSDTYRGFTPEAVRQAREYGYLTGYYHLYSWLYRPKSGGYTAEQAKVAIKDAQGIFEAGHEVWGKHTLYCPTLLGRRLAEAARGERKAGFSAFFTDCTIAGDSLRDCYDPQHPLTVPESAAALREAVGEVNRTGMITGSERGFWYAAKTCAWFEGIETLGSYFWRFQGPAAAQTHAGPMQNQRPGFERLFVNYNYGPQNRVPLFQLVFHDSVYCTRRWDDHHTRQPELWRANDLMAICYGVAPIVTFHHQIGPHILKDDFGPFLKRYQRTYREVCGWHERIGFEEMMDHQFLTKDRKVQQTTFASGKSVIVNFDKTARDAGKGRKVEGMSYLVVE